MAEQQTPPTWDAFIADAASRGASDADLGTLKDIYFSTYVAPRFDEKDLGTLREAFDSRAVIPEKPGFVGELSKGFQRGLATKGMGLTGSAALAAQATGDRASIDRANQMVRRQAADMQQYQSPYSNYENVHSLGDFGRFAGSSIGEMAGNVLPTMGAAALSGPLAPVTAGADILTTTAGNQYAQALQRADDNMALDQLGRGQPVDLRDSYQNIDQGKLAVGTLGTSALEAAGYALGPAGRLIFRGKAGLGKTATDLLTKEGPLGSRLGNAGLGVAGGAFGEGTTEFFQEFSDEYGAGNPDWLSWDTARQGLQAGASAALGGGVLGGVGGAFQAPAGSAAARDVGETYGDQLDSEGLLGEPNDRVRPTVRAEDITNHATQRIDELLRKRDGTPDQLTTDPETGKKQVIRGEQPMFMRPEEKDELFFLLDNRDNPEALANAYGHDLDTSPSPAEISKAAKEEALGRIDALESVAPDLFEVVEDKKNRITYVPELSLSEFTKKIQANWKASVPQPSEAELDEAFAQAVEGGYNKDYKAFVNEAKKQREVEYEQENPRLSSQQIVPLWRDYKELHGNDVRDFRAARDWVGSMYEAPNQGLTTPSVSTGNTQLDVKAPGATTITTGIQSEGLPAGTSGGKLFTPTPPGATNGQTELPLQEGQSQAGNAAQGPQVTPAAPPVAPVKTKPKNRRMVDPEEDDLVLAVRKLGGINVDLETDFAGRLKSIPTPTIVGIGNVERTKGKGRSLDDLAESLVGYGYLTSEDPKRELYEKLEAATSGAQHWSTGKQGAESAPADNGTDLWIERLDQAGTEEDIAEIARSAGNDPRFQARFANDPAFADAWRNALDNALEQTAPLEPRQTPAEDLMPTATTGDQVTADKLALEEAQKEKQRKLNATDAPRGGGLFDQDNRQDDLFTAPTETPNAPNPGQSVATDVPGTPGEIPVAGSGERGPVGGVAGTQGQPADGGTGAVSGPQPGGDGAGVTAAGIADQPDAALTPVNRDSALVDGATVYDGEGKPYRVYGHRNDLVRAHPIVDGKPQVNSESTVRFWVNPDTTPSGDNDRTDPIYTSPPTPKASKPERTPEDVESLKDRAKAAYVAGDLEIPQYMMVLNWIYDRNYDAVDQVMAKVDALNKGTQNMPARTAAAVKKAKARGGADIKRLVQLLGGQMYDANLADVSIKEMLQNSFDAVKASVAGKKTKEGKIDVAVDSGNRLIIIRDNGQGMTPKIVQDAFLTLAGTNKEGLAEGESSGGFGMAKAAFLTGSEQIWVSTTKGGIKTTFTFKGSEFFDKDIEMQQEAVDESEHGTTIVVKLPEKVKTATGEQQIWFPYSERDVAFFDKPLLNDNIEVRFGKVYYPGEDFSELLDPESFTGGNTWRQFDEEARVVPVAKHTDMSGYNEPLTTRFAWGTAEVYIGKERKKWPKHSVLSAGIYQFNYPFMIRGYEQIPYDIIVNVKPTVKAEATEYPFDIKREGWKGVVKQDVEALSNYLKQVAAGIDAEETVANFKNIKSLPRVDVEQSSGASTVDLTDFIQQKPKAAKAPSEKKAAPKIPKTVDIEGGKVTATDTDGLVKTLWDSKAEKSKEKYNSKFSADKAAPAAKEFLLDMGIDENLPVFHNNTSVDYAEMSPQANVMFAEIGSLMLKMRDKVADVAGYGYESLSQRTTPFFVGVSIDKAYHGVNLVVPFQAALLNPMAVKGKSLPSIVTGLYDTLVHEFAHVSERSHNERFVGAYHELNAKLAADGFNLEMQVQLARVLKKHQGVYNELRDKFEESSTKNLAKSLHDGEENGGVASARDQDGTNGRPAADVRNPRDAMSGGRGGAGGGGLRGNAGSGQSGQNRGGSNPARQNALGDMAPSLVNATRDLFTDKAVDATLNLLLNPIQVAELNPQYPSAGSYADATQAMQVDMLRNQHRIAGLVDRMARLPKVSKDLLMDLMTKSTLLGVNPDIGANESVKQMIDGRDVEVSNAHLASRSNGAKQHEAMKRAYDALPANAKSLYTEIRNHFADSWNRRIETIRSLAEESDISPDVRAKLNKEMDALAAKITGPYFPLMREGRFAVIWKSQDLLDAEEQGDTATVDRLKESASDYWVRFTDSQSEAKSLSEEAPEGMKGNSQGDYKLRTSQSRDAEGASSAFMSNLEEALAKRISDGTVRDDVMQSIRGVFLQTLPELSVMKRTLMRRGVAGVNADDMLQSIARAGIADAHYLARISHMSDIVTALSNLRKEDAKPLRGKKPGVVGTPQGGIGRVYNSMMTSFKADMIRPEASGLNSVANKLIGLSYMHSLALDTGNLVANVLQPQMTSFPLMGAKYGFAKAEKAMVSALADTVKMVGGNLRAKSLDVTRLPNTLGEHEAVASMLDLAELSQSRELAMIGRGQSRKWNTMLETLAVPSHYVETVSRLSTMLAAYRLEMSRINSDPNYSNRSPAERQGLAVRYASRLSGESLGNYTAGGVPNALRGNHQALTRLALQFKRYAITMLYLYGKAARDSFKGDREAQKTLGALLTLQFTIAGGLSGLPAALPAKMIAALFPGDDDDESEEQKLDRLANAMAGGDKTLGTWLRKGPLSAMTGIDVSRKMGLGDLLSLNISSIGEAATESIAGARRRVMGNPQVAARNPNEKWTFGRLLDDMLPAASFMNRVWNGVGKVSDGKLADGVVAVLPKNALSSMFNEVVLGKTRKSGLTNQPGTVQKLAPEKYSDWDIFLKSIDMPLLLESDTWDKNSAWNAVKQPKADRRADILERYVAAKKRVDKEAVASIEKEIARFNQSLPEDARKSMKIDRADMISRMNSAKKADKQMETAGGVRASKKERKWARSVTDTYNQ